MWRIVLIIMSLAPATQARANDVPELVKRFIDEARGNCLKAGGKPEPNPEISGVDLNGDGHTDWVVHYKGYCPGAPGHFCRDADCMFEIFIGRPEGGPRLFINQSAITWRTGRVRGLPALIFYRPNQSCPRGKRVCDETYVFDRKGAMRHLR